MGLLSLQGISFEQQEFTPKKVNNTTVAQKSPSIFLDAKSSEKKVENKNELNDQQLMQKIASTQENMIQKYHPGKQLNKAEDLEKQLGRSKIPNLPTVGSFVYTQIKSIADKINSLTEEIGNKCANCKTEDEIKNALKDIEAEMKQQKHKADVYIQRGQRSLELNNKLGPMFNDPEKAKLMENIDFDKITSKLTEPVEDVSVADSNENKELDEQQKTEETDKAFKDALENDEISQVVTSLIKYADKGEKDSILNDYIKDDTENNEQLNNTFSQQPFSTNPFNSNTKNLFNQTAEKEQKKNPFFFT